MLRAVADTHTVIWYLYDDPCLSAAARAAIETAAADGDQVGCSAITLAEIVYLGERGRIHPAVFGRLLKALDQPGAVIRDLPFDRGGCGLAGSRPGPGAGSAGPGDRGDGSALQRAPDQPGPADPPRRSPDDLVSPTRRLPRAAKRGRVARGKR